MKKRQPSHLNRYANLAGKQPRKAATKGRRRSSNNRVIRWWQHLSHRQKIMAIIAPVLAFLIITPIATYAILARDISDPERLMNRNNTGIVLDYNDGTPFYSVGRSEHREMVPLTEIPKITQQALIASEDKDFYKHGGFSLFSIARAAFTRVGGGSTLTQQLAKNTLLSDNRSYFRKYQELCVSVAIEQQYSKDEILTMYLNSVFYGENAFGIQEAAKAYFDKEPKDLDLAESAMLVGLLPAPSAYSPISGNAEYAKQRQTTVLTRMVNNGFITEQQKTDALSQELVYGSGAKNDNSVAPHFVTMVINQLSAKYGYEKVMRSGYQIKTTLDKSAQDALTKNITDRMGYIAANGGSNAAGVIIDPKNGEVRALVGSADYANEKWGKVNMVTTARQPGSSFKSIYYAAALGEGVITPSSIYRDEKTDFGGGYTPNNADRQWHGDVSVRRSLDWSLNIPSIKIMQDYGIDKSVDAARKLGISLPEGRDYDLTLALGSAEATPLQMTNAYAAFANQGQQHGTIYYTEVNDKYNKRIESNASIAKAAVSKEAAFLISDILADNQARSGIFGSSLTVPGHTAAVKTGTTNDNRDAWTIGYTPSYAIGVWVGNNDNSAMANGGVGMAGPIWRLTMSQLLQGKENEQFVVPGTITQRLTCSSNGGLATQAGADTYNEYYISTSLPSKTCNAKPVTIEVCNLDTNKVETIDEKNFKSEIYSKNIDDCKSVQVQVCDTSSGTVITIDEEDFDSEKQTRDTQDCQKRGGDGEPQVQACDTDVGRVVMIDQSAMDGRRYTTNTTNCVRTAP